MNKLILISLLFMFLTGFTSFPPSPECPNCQNGWSELWHIPKSSYCGGGDYFIWHCRELNGKDILYTSVCLSSSQPVDEVYTVYIPYMVKE